MLARLRWSVLAAALVSTVGLRTSAAATLVWKGLEWQVTSGGMAGVCEGNASNVSVDSDGFLHLKITQQGTKWSAAEVFTTSRLGFGTYQWQIDGPIDVLDKNVVLGLFPYGPAANIGGDGTNEIDIEYSRWGRASGPNGDWINYPASGTTVGELSYTFSLGGQTESTSRFLWAEDRITDFLLSGFEPVGSMNGLIKSWTYAPANPAQNIPQQPLPLGMNLWCFDAPPSDGKPVEIIVRDFVQVPLGNETGGAGGMAGTGGGGGVITGGSATLTGGLSAGGKASAGGTTGGNTDVAGAPSGGMISGGAAAGGNSGSVSGGAMSAGASVSGAATGATASGGVAASGGSASGGKAVGGGLSGAPGNPSQSRAGCACALGAPAGASWPWFVVPLWLSRLRARRSRR
jgi:hypothetical protein